MEGMALNKKMFFFFSALIVISLITPVFASEHEAPRWGDFGWRVLNIIIFVGIIWYFVGNMAKKYFKNRRNDIVESLDNLDARRATAKENLAKVEERIKNLDEERRAILEESRNQAESIKAVIISEAKVQADQIIEQARLVAENEGRAILAEVRAKIADEIIDKTEKVLAQKLDVKAHEDLIAKALVKVVLQ